MPAAGAAGSPAGALAGRGRARTNTAPASRLSGIVSGLQAEGVGTTTVHFADITDAEIAAYVATEEPLSVAGSFTLDGRGGAFVDRIEGDPGNVIGLSLPLLRNLLGEMDISITQLWRK